MSTAAVAPEMVPTDSISVAQMLAERIAKHGQTDAYYVRDTTDPARTGQWNPVQYDELYEDIQIVASALLDFGYQRGDRLSVLANTCYDWTVLDFAALSIGVIVVPIYQSSIPSSVRYILADCEAKGIVCENAEQLEKVQEVRGALPKLEHFFGFNEDGSPDGITIDTLRERGRKLDRKAWKAASKEVTGEDIATIVYTSGTTGDPKGAMLSHGNLTGATYATCNHLEQETEWITLLFLPLAHIFARIVQFGAFYIGAKVAYVESMDPQLIAASMREIRPHVLPSVPRVYEKVYTKIQASFEAATGARRRLIDFAQRVGEDVSRLRQYGQEPSGLLRVKFRLANRLVFQKVKDAMGGRIRYGISGGAPLAPEIARFFHRNDIPIMEGYGLTESTASPFCNKPDDFKFGTVGLCSDGSEIKIADDGEILLKGPGVFKGYWNKPDATAEVLSDDGWFKTGDIGELDRDGFLRITDRKKNIIVTAGGKNIAPAFIENKIKTSSLVSQVLVHGDKRKFLSALITLNPEAMKEAGVDREKAKIQLAAHLELVNTELESYQQIKKHVVVDEDFTIENDMLTPTLKVRRKQVESRYADVLDSLYT